MIDNKPNVKTFVLCHDCNLRHNITNDAECLIAMNPNDRELFDTKLKDVKNKICTADFSDNIDRFNPSINEVTGIYCVYKHFPQICQRLGWEENKIDAIKFRHYRRKFRVDLENVSGCLNYGEIGYFWEWRLTMINRMGVNRCIAQCLKDLFKWHINKDYEEQFNKIWSYFINVYFNADSNANPKQQIFVKYMICLQIPVFMKIFDIYYNIFLKPYIECQDRFNIMSMVNLITGINRRYHPRILGYISEIVFGWIMNETQNNQNFPRIIPTTNHIVF